MSTDQITEAAIALPEKDRRELVRKPIDTLPEEEIRDEFYAELVRRDAEMEAGRDPGLTREEMMEVARKAIRCDCALTASPLES